MTPEEFTTINGWSKERIRQVGQIGLSRQDATLVLDTNPGFTPLDLFHWCRVEHLRHTQHKPSYTTVRVNLHPQEYAAVRDALKVIRTVYENASALYGRAENKKWRDELPSLHSKSKSVLIRLPD